MEKRITPAMMAEAIGIPVQTIRVGLQAGAFDFGTAFQPSGRNYTYVIYPEKARETVGDEVMRKWGF